MKPIHHAGPQREGFFLWRSARKAGRYFYQKGIAISMVPVSYTHLEVTVTKFYASWEKENGEAEIINAFQGIRLRDDARIFTKPKEKGSLYDICLLYTSSEPQGEVQIHIHIINFTNYIYRNQPRIEEG